MLSPFHPLQMSLGFIVWLVYFSVIYGALSVVCVTAPPEVEQGPFNALNLALLVLTLITGGWLLYEAYRCRKLLRAAATQEPADEHNQRDAGAAQLKGFRRLTATLAVGVNLVAGIATLAVGVPVLVLSPCV